MRWTTVLLVLSLAANVFLGGFVAGRLMGHGPHGPHRGAPPIPILGAVENLSPEGRAILHAAFETQRENLRAVSGRMRERRATAAAALAADPLNRAEMEKAFQEIEALEDETHGRVVVILLDAAEKLSPEDRKALADALRREGRGRRHGYSGHRPPN